MIDPEKIFSLFDRADKDLPIKEKAMVADQLATLQDTPAFKLGIFRKIVLNHINFNKHLLQFINRTGEELDINDVRNAGEFIIYNRAWNYIKDIDIRNPYDFKALKEGSTQEFITAIKLSISYFQEEEEYEKCAHLKKIEDASSYFVR